MKNLGSYKSPKSPSSGRFSQSLGEYEDIESNGEESDGILNNMTEESDESSEEEVLTLRSNSDIDSSEDEEDEISDDAGDENNISDSDLDQPNDDFPDSKAWGKKKRLYYNADHINDKNEYLNEEDEQAAKMEEEEAKIIQKRLISEIDNADLSLDLLSDIIAEKEDERYCDERPKIILNLSQMNVQEKMKLLKKESPKFLTAIEDYKRLMKCLQNDLIPIVKLWSPSRLQNFSAGKFIILYSQLIMNYCTNVSFYTLLKSRRADSESHPIHDWISRYHEMLVKFERIFLTHIKPQMESILSGHCNLFETQKKKKAKLPMLYQDAVEMVSDDENTNNDGTAGGDDYLSGKDNERDQISDDEDDDSKRPITYQIAKNKGLTPHRKKELRNPRVKHRMKYRKAKIRRKGQIREVRKELQRYCGEISGIKATVVKSVKLKH